MFCAAHTGGGGNGGGGGGGSGSVRATIECHGQIEVRFCSVWANSGRLGALGTAAFDHSTVAAWMRLPARNGVAVSALASAAAAAKTPPQPHHRRPSPRDARAAFAAVALQCFATRDRVAQMIRQTRATVAISAADAVSSLSVLVPPSRTTVTFSAATMAENTTARLSKGCATCTHRGSEARSGDKVHACVICKATHLRRAPTPDDNADRNHRDPYCYR